MSDPEVQHRTSPAGPHFKDQVRSVPPQRVPVAMAGTGGPEYKNHAPPFLSGPRSKNRGQTEVPLAMAKPVEEHLENNTTTTARDGECTCTISKYKFYGVLFVSFLMVIVVLAVVLVKRGNDGGGVDEDSSIIEPPSNSAVPTSTTAPTTGQTVAPIPSATTERPALQTDAPTQSATAPAQRAADVAAYINSVRLSNTNITYPPSSDSATPEELALQWLIEDDPLQLSADQGAGQFRLRQRYALLTLWYHQSKYRDWKDSTGWLTDPDECHWYGLTCVQEQIFHGPIIRQYYLQDVVSEIDLDGLVGEGYRHGGNNLHYTDIPADIGLLTSLSSLKLSFNSIDGTIPASLYSSLSKLTF